MDGISYIVGTWKSISLSLHPLRYVTIQSQIAYEANSQTEPDLRLYVCIYHRKAIVH